MAVPGSSSTTQDTAKAASFHPSARFIECPEKCKSRANAVLISEAELHEIRRIWRTEESDWEDFVPVIYRQVVGEDLDWVRDDVTTLTAKDQGVLKEVCNKHGTPADLVAKLIDVE